MVPLLVLSLIIVCLTIDSVVQRSARRACAAEVSPAPGAPDAPPVRRRVHGASRLEDLPRGVFVGRGHTWIQLEPSGSVRMGVDMLPLTLLGEVDSLEALPAGSAVRQGEAVATLRHGDRTVVLHSPVAGVVDRVNREVLAHPESLRERPDRPRWIVRIAPQRLARALQGMVVAEDAAAWMLQEDLRLRELVSRSPRTSRAPDADRRGEDVPLDGLAEHLDRDEWGALSAELFDSDALPEPIAQRLAVPTGGPR